eukprot:m51a1_g10556 hypothetical protein (312) ;mRNA; r:62047-63045
MADPAIEIRPLTPELYDACTALVHEEEWDNFSNADWERCRALTHASGLWCALSGGAVVGACVMERPCEQYTWISVMFVTSAFRSRGVGALLFARAAEYATSCGASLLGADCASPAVQRMLEGRFGSDRVHVDCETQYRWRPDLDNVIASLPAPGQGVFELDLGSADFDRAVELDRAVTGFDKSRAYRRMPCLRGWGLRDGSQEVVGFVLSREGFSGMCFGPLVAPSREGAQALLCAAIRASNPAKRNSTCDMIVCDCNAEAMSLLDSLGFPKDDLYLSTRVWVSLDTAHGRSVPRYSRDSRMWLLSGLEIG